MAWLHATEIYSSTSSYHLQHIEIYKLKSGFKGKTTGKDSSQDYTARVSPLINFNHKICVFNSPAQPLSLTFIFPLFFFFSPPKRTEDVFTGCQTDIRFYCLCIVFTCFKTLFIIISKRRKPTCISNKETTKEMH